MALASGGTLGTGTSSASGSSFAFNTTTSALAVGDLAILVVVTDNLQTSTGTSTDHTGVSGTNLTATKLGEYTNGQSAAAAGLTTSLWLLEATGTVSIGAAVTMSLSGAVVDKACSAWRFTKGAGMAVRLGPDFSPNPVMSAVNAANGFGSSALASSPSTSTSRLFFRALGKEANSTTALTLSSGFTAITAQRSRNNASAVLVRGEFRINTSTGETSNPAMAVSGDTAGVFVALEEYDPRPVITAQPSNQTGLVGGTATFSFSDTGASSRQWQEFIAGEGGSAPNIVGTALPVTSGANGLTVPSGAQSMVLLYSYWHGTFSTPVITAPFAVDLAANMAFANGNSTPPYASGMLRSHAPVTAVGSQTLTISGQTDIFNGPHGYVVFFDAPITIIDQDAAAGGEAPTAAITLDSESGAIFIVADVDLDTNTPPANPSGWTSVAAGGFNNQSMRVRTKDSVADGTETANANGSFYRNIMGFMIRGGSAGSWEDIAGETTNALVIEPLVLEDTGRSFRANSTNSYGTVTTDAVTLTVTDGKLLYISETTGGVEVADDGVTVPSIAMQAGDLDILIIGAGVIGGAAPAITTPTGYTKANEATDLPLAGVVNTTLCLFWRYADGPASSIPVVADANSLWGWTRICYRYPHPSGPIEESLLGHLPASTEHVLPGYDASKTDSAFIAWVSQALAQGGTVPPPMVRRVNNEAGGIVLGEEQIAEIGPTGTRTITVASSADTTYATVGLNSLASASGGGTGLTPANLAHTQALDAVVLSTLQPLGVAGLVHAHGLDAVVLSTQGDLSVARLLHGHVLDALTLSTSSTTLLTPDGLVHSNTLDAVTVSALESLTVARLLHGHALGAVALSSLTGLTVADLLQAHSLDSPAVNTALSLALADLLHAHSLDAVALSSATSLAPADLTHGHALDAVALSSLVVLALADLLHAHALDAVTLSTDDSLTLNVADMLHAHTLESPMLVTEVGLTVARLVHAQSLEEVTLGALTALVVADMLHAHALDAVVLSDVPALQVARLTHAHTLDSVTLSALATLVVSDMLHAHRLEGVTLSGDDVETDRALIVRGRPRVWGIEGSPRNWRIE